MAGCQGKQCTSPKGASFTCVFHDDETGGSSAGAPVRGELVLSELLTIVKCPVPKKLQIRDSLKVTLQRNGGLDFQKEVASLFLFFVDFLTLLFLYVTPPYTRHHRHHHHHHHFPPLPDLPCICCCLCAWCCVRADMRVCVCAPACVYVCTCERA
jgi:hypothetical protein